MTESLDPGNNITAILSQAAAAIYQEGWGWMGTLTHFELDAGYWLIMNNADELDVLSCEGPMQDLLVYDLIEGANLISYPASGLSDVSQAIPDQVENLFSAISRFLNIRSTVER